MSDGCPPALSGKFKDSFAYKTIKDRLPVILAKVIDTTHRQRHEFGAAHGQKGLEDVKNAVNQLAELRYRMTTNKTLLEMTALSATDPWRSVHSLQWFEAPWLLIECYLYRNIMYIFQQNASLQHFDPFAFQKEQAFICALPAAKAISVYVAHSRSRRDSSLADRKHVIATLLRLSLWSNRCDLSISAGQVHSTPEDQLDRLEQYERLILADDIDAVVEYLFDVQSENRRVDIVLDNAGLELFADLCLAECLLHYELATVVHFHCKAIPWFVSDTTLNDFTWTLEMLRASDHAEMNEFGHHLHTRVDSGQIVLHASSFWTLPHDYAEMRHVDAQLYAELACSRLLIFKGDLNYRKLLGDLDWPPTTPFVDTLRGFAPASLVALRTLKADLVAGLTHERFDATMTENGGTRDWMNTGEYGVIQWHKV